MILATLPAVAGTFQLTAAYLLVACGTKWGRPSWRISGCVHSANGASQWASRMMHAAK
jgi:hypothetical protein